MITEVLCIVYTCSSLLQEANSCDGEIQQLRDHQTQLSSQLEQGQLNVQALQSNSDTIDGDIDRLIEVKQKVMYSRSNSYWGRYYLKWGSYPSDVRTVVWYYLGVEQYKVTI